MRQQGWCLSRGQAGGQGHTKGSLPVGQRSRSPPAAPSRAPSEHPRWGWGHAGSDHPGALALPAFHSWCASVALEEHSCSFPVPGKTGDTVWEGFWCKSLGQRMLLPAQHGLHVRLSLAVPREPLPSPSPESRGLDHSQTGWLQSGQAGAGEMASKGSPGFDISVKFGKPGPSLGLEAVRGRKALSGDSWLEERSPSVTHLWGHPWLPPAQLCLDGASAPGASASPSADQCSTIATPVTEPYGSAGAGGKYPPACIHASGRDSAPTGAARESSSSPPAWPNPS